MKRSYLQIIKHLFLLVSALVLVACTSSQHVPVIDSVGQEVIKDERYVVQKGDSLYSIAFRYSLNYLQLAAANNIAEPYKIYPGDVIYLREAPIKISKPAPPPSPKPAEKPKIVDKKPDTSTVPFHQDGPWIWPVKGKIIKGFDNSLSKGIDIAAAIGTPIRSSKAGTVIYAGDRLKGYGNLIIVRHDSRYLSAYAHNRAILVKEGQNVKQGDIIAELGMSGAETPKLHFEIRLDGKPINPAGLLPK